MDNHVVDTRESDKGEETMVSACGRGEKETCAMARGGDRRTCSCCWTGCITTDV